jgi:hypothetical protein
MGMFENLRKALEAMPRDYRETAEENGYVYLHTKAYLYVQMGPDVYRKQDYFKLPAVDSDPADLAAIESGCRQILAGDGFSAARPFKGLGISGFYRLLELFHFSRVRQSIGGKALSGKGFIDQMFMRHAVDERHIILYNEVLYED